MNAKQANRAMAKHIQEMEHTIAQYKADVQDYYTVIEDQIDGKSPCPWCEDYVECQLDAKDGFGCLEWLLRFRKPGSQPEGGELDGEEGKAAGTDLNPIFGVEE